MKLDQEQRQIIRELVDGGRQARRRYGWSPRQTRKAINTAIAVGFTESRWHNLAYGDRDSEGWRQERKMYYKDPRNLKASIRRFYEEYQADASPSMNLGDRAQAVQQSGTPDVWDSLAPMANQLRKRFGATNARYRPHEGRQRASQIVTAQSPERQELKRGLLDVLGQEGLDSQALLAYKAQKDQLQDVPAATRAGKKPDPLGAIVVTSLNPKLANTAGRTPQDILRLAEKADRLNNAGKLPYQWGGGHGLSPAKIGELVDCSGFVSQLLGVSPRVSGQFASSWGKPGIGKFVTVWANEGHVLISVRDPRTKKMRWFGTSRSNPGGGAGEISQPPVEYLRGFTPRHPGRAGGKRKRRR